MNGLKKKLRIENSPLILYMKFLKNESDQKKVDNEIAIALNITKEIS